MGETFGIAYQIQENRCLISSGLKVLKLYNDQKPMVTYDGSNAARCTTGAAPLEWSRMKVSV